MEHQRDGGERVRGVRGFELDAHLSFAHPLSRDEATRVLSAWGLRTTLYGLTPDGEGEVRAARLTGSLAGDEVRRLLQVGLEGGVLRGAELGLRGFLRSPSGATDYVPWRRNVVLASRAWHDVKLEEGVRYVLE